MTEDILCETTTSIKKAHDHNLRNSVHGLCNPRRSCEKQRDLIPSAAKTSPTQTTRQLKKQKIRIGYLRAGHCSGENSSGLIGH